jgi:hypothetical protein
MVFTWRKLAAAAVLAGMFLAGNGAQAGNTPAYTYKKVITYKIVEKEIVRQVPCHKKVVRYDACGNPYIVTVTEYKTVVETVCVTVPVVTWVKVGY